MAKKKTTTVIEFEDAGEAKELHDALELVLELAAANMIDDSLLTDGDKESLADEAVRQQDAMDIVTNFSADL